MKNTVKRATSLFMAMLMILSAMISVSGLSLAADIETETEPNDASNTATVIPTDTLCRGMLSDGDDIDWFKFNNDKDYFNIDFIVDTEVVNADNIEHGWCIEIFDKKMNLIKAYGATESFSSTNFAFDGEVFVKITPCNTYYFPKHCTYGIEMTTVKDKYWESECNDSSVDANTLTDKKQYHGSLYKAEDADWYKFTNNKDYFVLDFGINKNTNYDEIERGWIVEIYLGDGATCIKRYVGINSNLKTTNLPFEGDFYVKVVADNTYYAPVDCYYDITVSTFTDSNWESESNNDSANANNISADKIYKGDLYRDEDVDYFVFETKTNAFNITIAPDETESADYLERGWHLSVYPFGSTEAIAELGGVTSERTTFDLPFKGKFVVRIAADNSYYSPVDCVYNLKVTSHKSSELWEKEYNETMATATKLSSGKNYNANLYKNYDEDYFKYTANTDGVLKIKFSRDIADDIGRGWYMKVTRADGTIIYDTTVQNSLSDTKNLIALSKGETIYIKVQPDNGYYSPDQINYQLRVDFTANPGKVTGLKASSNKTTSVKLSWKALDGATGYRVYRYDAASKKYVIVATTKSTSYTVKNLKAGTSYKFVVKAYKKVDGSNLWGSTSAALTTATTPDTPTLKVAAGKKSATLKWSKETGTGYVVYMATSKNGKYSKIATVKGSSNISTVKKNLTTGKTYYFKVRAYKTVGDSNLYGAYTTVKAVKVK